MVAFALSAVATLFFVFCFCIAGLFGFSVRTQRAVAGMTRSRRRRTTTTRRGTREENVDVRGGEKGKVRRLHN